VLPVRLAQQVLQEPLAQQEVLEQLGRQVLQVLLAQQVLLETQDLQEQLAQPVLQVRLALFLGQLVQQDQQVHKVHQLLLRAVLPRLLICRQMETQLMTHTSLMQMEIFMSGMDQLGIALDKLLAQQDRKVLLDQRVLQEQQALREQLDLLELPELWAQLDRLVPQEQQETQD
jgi:hypothetical protein